MGKNVSKFDEDFIKNFDEDSDEGYIVEVDIEYPKDLHEMHNKCNKLIYMIKNYVVHIRALKQTLDHGLISKKVHKVIQFIQGAWLKEYIDMNTELRKQAKNDFEKNFFKLMKNSVFDKTMENVRKHRDIKLVTKDKRRNKLVSEPNYHKRKFTSKINEENKRKSE